MKLNSVVNVETNEKSLVNPLYEKNAISILTQALIRVIDIIGAIFGIIMILPITIYVFLERVKNKEKGPLFYSQERIGKNGKIFRMYKLNTEPILSEFPQFINVLLGQMTLVGPRPYTEEEIDKMEKYYDLLVTIKPGLTGVYQIAGKTKISFEDRLDLDLHYVFNQSITLNFKILLITIFVTSKKDRKDLYNKIIYSEMPKETLVEYVSKNVTLFTKRVVDIVCSMIGLIILLPLTVIIWFVNFISKEDGPVFYSHERIGKNGKKFKMYKFRTMIVDADAKLRDILEKDEDLRKEFEKTRKLKNDPRITKIGNFLRKTSIDEFPQFVNVIKGEMSLIGPRAVVDGEIEKFGDKKEKVLSVKPGVTGYWAANGRSNTTYEERVEMETYYAENMSISLDIKILFKTFISVLKKEGAV